MDFRRTKKSVKHLIPNEFDAFKAALINMFVLANEKNVIFNVKGVTCSDDLTYHPAPQPPTVLHAVLVSLYSLYQN